MEKIYVAHLMWIARRRCENFCSMGAAFNTLNTPKAMETKCLLQFVTSAWRGLSQRNSMRRTRRGHQRLGSRSKIRKRQRRRGLRQYILDKFSILIAGIYCSCHRPKPFGKLDFVKLPFWYAPRRSRDGSNGKSRSVWQLCGSFSRNNPRNRRNVLGTRPGYESRNSRSPFRFGDRCALLGCNPRAVLQA